ncbi:MAG: dethiobiotin synthase [Bacteroidota bacterium]
MMKGVSIVGIGTDVGKTVVSAIISEALGARYFKPAQAGDLNNSDSMKVDRLTSDRVTIAPEAFRLKTPMAPHGAAKIDGVEMRVSDIQFPQSDQPIVLEGAGGLMVPLNEHDETFLDIYKKSGLPVVVVSRHYLGSINHTLLTIDRLKLEGLNILGIVFVGDENEVTESIVEHNTGVQQLARIPWAEELNLDFVKTQAEKLKGLVYELS